MSIVKVNLDWIVGKMFLALRKLQLKFHASCLDFLFFLSSISSKEMLSTALSILLSFV